MLKMRIIEHQLSWDGEKKGEKRIQNVFFFPL